MIDAITITELRKNTKAVFDAAEKNTVTLRRGSRFYELKMVNDYKVMPKGLSQKLKTMEQK